MPICSHRALSLAKIYDYVNKENNNSNIISGQNVDTLYNLGPTHRSAGGILKRYLLSNYFINTLNDVNSSNINIQWSLINKLTNFAFSLQNKYSNFDIPRNSKELIKGFRDNQGYNPLTKNNITDDSLKSQFSSKEVFENIYDNKIKSFFDSGDSKVLHRLKKNNINDIILPFDNNVTVLFFRKLNRNIKDIISPKRYIVKYLKNSFCFTWHLKVLMLR